MQQDLVGVAKCLRSWPKQVDEPLKSWRVAGSGGAGVLVCNLRGAGDLGCAADIVQLLYAVTSLGRCCGRCGSDMCEPRQGGGDRAVHTRVRLLTYVEDIGFGVREEMPHHGAEGVNFSLSDKDGAGGLDVWQLWTHHADGRALLKWPQVLDVLCQGCW
eukprot:3322354-Amphidinium_carterae.3